MCSEGDSCSFSHDTQASDNSGAGQRRKGRSSSPASRSKAKRTDGEGQKSSKGSGKKGKALQTRVKFHADSNSVKTRHVSSGALPVCQNYKSEKGCVYGDGCHSRLVEAEGKTNKRSQKGGAKDLLQH